MKMMTMHEPALALYTLYSGRTVRPALYYCLYYRCRYQVDYLVQWYTNHRCQVRLGDDLDCPRKSVLPLVPVPCS